MPMHLPQCDPGLLIVVISEQARVYPGADHLTWLQLDRVWVKRIERVKEPGECRAQNRLLLQLVIPEDHTPISRVLEAQADVVASLSIGDRPRMR